MTAVVVNSVAVCVWGVRGPGAWPPYESPAGPVLLTHALGGLQLALSALVATDLLGETPGRWTERVFLLAGLVLMLPLGGVGVFVSVKHGSAVQIFMAILCSIVGLLLLADFVYLEKLYCWVKTPSQNS